jgi:hypothetical protein
MSKVLDFHPRLEYDEIRWQRYAASIQNPTTPDNTLTPGELYGILYGETAERCKQLIQFYKHSGKWNPETESQMTKIVKSLQTLCETIAHNTTRTK